MIKKDHLKRIKESFVSIDRVALAKKMKCTRNYIDGIASGWQKVSPERALKIERLTDGVVSAEILRPDIFNPKVRRSA